MERKAENKQSIWNFFFFFKVRFISSCGLWRREFYQSWIKAAGGLSPAQSVSHTQQFCLSRLQELATF